MLEEQTHAGVVCAGPEGPAEQGGAGQRDAREDTSISLSVVIGGDVPLMEVLSSPSSPHSSFPAGRDSVSHQFLCACVPASTQGEVITA